MKGLITGAALLAAFLLQTAVLPAFGVSSVAPDLLFSVLIPASMLWEPIPTAFMGAAAGLLMDVLFGHGIGMYSVFYLALPWVTGVYCRQFYRENAFIPASLAGVAVVLREAVILVMMYLDRTTLSITWGLLLRVLACALLTAGMAIPYHLTFYGFLLKNERRRPGLFYFGR